MQVLDDKRWTPQCPERKHREPDRSAGDRPRAAPGPGQESGQQKPWMAPLMAGEPEHRQGTNEKQSQTRGVTEAMRDGGMGAADRWSETDFGTFQGESGLQP